MDTAEVGQPGNDPAEEQSLPGWRIGDVAELLNLKTHVLRFWETEFPQLAPLRTESGQRLYTEEHVAMLRRIKNLLHEQGMTIEGAKRVLNGLDVAPDPSDVDFIARIGLELASICELLKEGASQIAATPVTEPNNRATPEGQ